VAVLVLISLACAADAARAQGLLGAIAGAVKDSSGAVMPGVTVEASSPALIEKTRSVVTDGSGQYQIINLRPGTYTVTFSLNGFITVKREGVELTGSFTATVNADLRVGGVAETVTVTAETPIVDVRGVADQRVIQKEVIDAIPAGRSHQDLVVLIPGMSGGPDVGGLNTLSLANVAIHGSRANDSRVYSDGMTLRNLGNASGSVSLYPDMGSTQEVVVDYAGSTGETMHGGVKVNYIPREGGNTFKGTAFGFYLNENFQSNNFTQELKDQGLTTPNGLYKLYDFNGSLGGPIMRDKLWFFSSARRQINGTYFAGLFYNKNEYDINSWLYEPDTSRRATNVTLQSSINTRLSWQLNPKNKFNFYFERQPRDWGSGTATTSPEAASRFVYPYNRIILATWSSPLTSRLLAEVRTSFHAEAINSLYPAAGDVRRKLIPVVEQAGLIPGLLYRGGGVGQGPTFIYSQQEEPNNVEMNASVSYVTGSHALKFGFSNLSGSQSSPQLDNDYGLSYRFQDGIPNQLTMRALPVTRLSTMTEGGVYAQDKWSIRRLTLTAGVRWDYLRTSYPEQHLGPGVNVPTRNFTIPETEWFNFNDLGPRIGANYDLFGNGKTSVKVDFARYITSLDPVGTNPILNLANTVTRAWTDANRDFFPTCNLLNLQQQDLRATGGDFCGTVSDLRFGQQLPSTSFDPATQRGFGERPGNWEFSGGVQHQLLPRVSANVTYFRRIYNNFQVTDNRLVTGADYSPYSITAPLDDRLPEGGGYLISGLYNLNPDKTGQVDNYVTKADNFGTQLEHWNGIDVGFNARLREGVLLQGGTSTGRTSTDNCDLVAKLDSPQSLYCHNDTRFTTQFKMLGTYRVPKVDVQLAATYQNLPGAALGANFTAGNALIQPSLGRPLSGGAANVTLALIAPGTVFIERTNELDLRFTKLFRFSRTKTALNFDLYNVSNASTVRSRSGTFGTTWQRPTGILDARLFKISAQIDF
jgi:hypothetical protein